MTGRASGASVQDCLLASRSTESAGNPLFGALVFARRFATRLWLALPSGLAAFFYKLFGLLEGNEARLGDGVVEPDGAPPQPCGIEGCHDAQERSS